MVLCISLPLLYDGSLPPVAHIIQWLAHLDNPKNTIITIDNLPPGNGSLPDLFSSAGIHLVRIAHPPITKTFRWEGWARGSVIVNSNDTDLPMPVHHGELPHAVPDARRHDDPYDLIDVARHNDAYAVHVARSKTTITAQGASWQTLLQALTTGGAQHRTSLPSVANQRAHESESKSETKFSVWNSFPFIRHALVTFSANSQKIPPKGLRNVHGARFPVQIVEDGDGQILLSAMPLGALECSDYEAIAHSVPSCHWEVNNTTIDNGRVRAELDADGHIIRLCTDGRFVDWTGPSLQPLCNGLPWSGTSDITVLENGPVRARLAINRTCSLGQLRIIYSLHAHEDVLRITATWTGDTKIQLNLPTSHRSSPITVAGELGQWHLPQRSDVDHSEHELVQGIHWARLHDDDNAGLAVIGIRPLTISATDGQIAIHLKQHASFALCENNRPKQDLGLGQLSQSLGMPHCAINSTAQFPAFRLVTDQLTACWLRRPDGWSGELILWQQSNKSSRCVLYIENVQDVQLCDVRGNSIQKLSKLLDCNGYACDVRGGDFALIRWR